MTKTPPAWTDPAHRPAAPAEAADAPKGAASFSWHSEASRARAPYEAERADDIADRLDAKYLDWQRQREVNFGNKRRYEVDIFTVIGWIWRYRAVRIALVAMLGLFLLMRVLSGL